VKYFANIHFGLPTTQLIQQIQLPNLVKGKLLAALYIHGALQTVHPNGKFGSTHHVELVKNMAYQVHVLI
jgi:hypothetical protein